MPTALQSKALLHRAIELVQSSSNIDQAVGHLAGALYPSFHVARVNVRMFLAPTNEVIVVGTWCAHPSSILPGIRMRASSTSYLDVVLEHGVVCGPRDGMTELTEDLIYRGASSWVSVPIPGSFRPDGVLTVAGSSSALKKEKAFFSDLGEAVGSRLALLARASAVYVRAMRAGPVLVMRDGTSPRAQHPAGQLHHRKL
jgi:hypothetical protein